MPISLRSKWPYAGLNERPNVQERHSHCLRGSSTGGSASTKPRFRDGPRRRLHGALSNSGKWGSRNQVPESGTEPPCNEACHNSAISRRAFHGQSSRVWLADDTHRGGCDCRCSHRRIDCRAGDPPRSAAKTDQANVPGCCRQFRGKRVVVGSDNGCIVHCLLPFKPTAILSTAH